MDKKDLATAFAISIIAALLGSMVIGGASNNNGYNGETTSTPSVDSDSEANVSESKASVEHKDSAITGNITISNTALPYFIAGICGIVLACIGAIFFHFHKR